MRCRITKRFVTRIILTIEYDTVSSEWLPTFRMHHFSSSRQEPLTRRTQPHISKDGLLTKKCTYLKSVQKSLCLDSDTCAIRCSSQIAILDIFRWATVRKFAWSTVAIGPFCTAERVSLSLVLRVARCHGGWWKEPYEKWRRVTLERSRPEGSRNSVKQIVFPHGYLARSLSLPLAVSATVIASTYPKFAPSHQKQDICRLMQQQWTMWGRTCWLAQSAGVRDQTPGSVNGIIFKRNTVHATFYVATAALLRMRVSGMWQTLCARAQCLECLRHIA